MPEATMGADAPPGQSTAELGVQASDGALGIATAGQVSVYQQFTVGREPVRRRGGTAYLQQVRRIAPPELTGREAELAELAAFCLDPDCGPYAWWQAGPWAGKSALLSSFILCHPPEIGERVRFVSFFITARLAAQDNRQAFTEVMLEQLAALTGQ
jgi:hypothetical protein